MHKISFVERLWRVVAVSLLAGAGTVFAFAPLKRVGSTAGAEAFEKAPLVAAPTVLQARKAAAAKRPDIRVVWDSQRAAPSVVEGADLLQEKLTSPQGLGVAAAPDLSEKAIRVMGKLAGVYGVQDAASEFSPRSVQRSLTGYQHVRLNQTYKGLPVFGAQVVVHFDRQGLARAVNGQYRSLGKLDTTPVLTGDQAIGVATADQAALGNPQGSASAPVLSIFARDAVPVLAYDLVIKYDNHQGGIGRWHYWVDAKTGTILLRYNDVPSVAAPTGGAAAVIQGNRLAGEGGTVTNVTGWLSGGRYYLWNTTDTWYLFNAGGGFHASDPDAYTYAFRNISDWGASDRAEISLGAAFEGILRYYRSVHGRNSFDDNGAMARANLHYGYSYVNAYWNGSDFTFGDGDGISANELTLPDIAGHEFTHAVTEYTAGLIYDYVDSGALNESFSDIFGTLIEFATQPDGRAAYPGRTPGHADWLCGEDCWLESTALRDLRNPSNRATVATPQPSRYHGRYWDGYGEMHQNDGVQNFFFYLLCEGGRGTNDGISYFVPGIGMGAAEKVAYLTLTSYMVPTADYPAARDYWLAAANETDAAGTTTNAALSVMLAWAAVGIGTAEFVLPLGNYAAGGTPVTGPYTPTNKVYTLLNPEKTNLIWTVWGSGAPWLNISTGAVDVAAGGSGEVSLSINQAVAMAMPPGTYLDMVTFTNRTGVGNTTRRVILRIGNNYALTSADYDWIDPVAGLHPVVSASTGVSDPYPLPFPVGLYDLIYTNLYITAYGTLGFVADGLNTSMNTDLPFVDSPNAIICPLWDEIDGRRLPARMYYKVLGEAPNRKVVVTWDAAPQISDLSATFSVQAIIMEASAGNSNNDIIFQYKDVAEQNDTYGSGQSATIGIEDEYGALGRKYSYNGQFWLANHTALKFTQSPEPDVQPPVGTIQALGGSGGGAVFEIKFNETVTGFDTNDVLMTSTIPGVVVDGIRGGGMRYLVSVTNVTALGRITMSVAGNAAADWAGNSNAPFGPAIYVVPVESVNFSDDMEKSAALWTTSTNGFDQLTQNAWEWGVPAYPYGPAAAFSGTHCWGTVLTGDYPNGMNAWVVSSPIAVGARPILDFELWHSLEFIDGPVDKGYVEVDNGSGFVNVTPGFQYSGESGGWIHQQIVLNNEQFGNRNIRVRFRATSDFSTTLAGMYVDDLVVSSQREPGVWVVDYTPTNGVSASSVPVSFTVYNSSTNTYSQVKGDVSSPYSGVSIASNTVPVLYGDMAPGDLASGAAAVDVVLAAAGNFTTPNLRLIHQSRSVAGSLSSDSLPFTVDDITENMATNRVTVTSGTGVTNWLGQYLEGGGGPTSCLYQVIAAGSNGVPDAPSLNGQVTGDDQLLFASGSFLPWGRFGEGAGIPADFGRFLNTFIHGLIPGDQVFVRAWDSSSFEGSVAYGDSSSYTILPGGAQSYNFGSWRVGIPLPSDRDANGDGIPDAYCVTNNMDPRLPIGPLAASWSLAQAALGSAGTGPQQFSATTPSPTRLFYKGDYLFVLDTGNNRIQIWNRLTRQYMGAYGSQGTNNGAFKRPVGLALDPVANRFAVADQGNSRIQVFTFNPVDPTNIVFQFSFGSYGTGFNQFMKPTDVAIDSYGWFYITDERVSSMDQSVVQIYDDAGYEFWTLAIAGSGPGQVHKPGGICVGPDDTILVADTENNRIQAFDSSWTLIWPLTGTNTVSFSKPRGVQVGLNGRVYVADTDNSQIKILKSDGSFIASLGSQGYGFNLVLNHPYGLMPVVESNIVYVADTFNNRVLTIAPIYDGDGDGMDDIWEELHGLNPNDPSDGMSDYNGNGILNIGEYRLNQDPGTPPATPLPVRITAFSVNPQWLQWEEVTNGGIYQVEYSFDNWFIASNSWLPGPIYTSAVNGALSVNAGLTLTNQVQYIRVKRLSP